MSITINALGYRNRLVTGHLYQVRYQTVPSKFRFFKVTGMEPPDGIIPPHLGAVTKNKRHFVVSINPMGLMEQGMIQWDPFWQILLDISRIRAYKMHYEVFRKICESLEISPYELPRTVVRDTISFVGRWWCISEYLIDCCIEQPDEVNLWINDPDIIGDSADNQLDKCIEAQRFMNALWSLNRCDVAVEALHDIIETL